MGLTVGLLEQLRHDIPTIVLRSGSATYIGIGQAGEVVRWLAARGHQVIGLEGFSCDGTAIRPSLEHIADLSDAQGPEAATRAAVTILDEWRGSIEWIDIESEPGPPSV